MQKYVDINNEHIQTLVFFFTSGLSYNKTLKQLTAQKWICNLHKIIIFWGEEPEIVYAWKVKLSLSTVWRNTGGEEVQLHLFLISALKGSEHSTSRRSHFILGKNPSAHWIEGWWGPVQVIWMFWKRGKFLAPAKIRTPDRPIHSLDTIPVMLSGLHMLERKWN